MSETPYTPAEAAIVAAALAVAVEQQVAAGCIPIPAPSAQQAAGSIDTGELRRLAEAATPGYWNYWPTTEERDAEIAAPCGVRVANLLQGDVTKDNSAFIAAANPAAILLLLNELDMVRSLYEGAHADRMDLAAATPAQPIAGPNANRTALEEIAYYDGGSARAGDAMRRIAQTALEADAELCKAPQPIAVSAPADERGAFEAWSKREGACNLSLALNDTCEDWRFPATYHYASTETAWRAWANKPARAAAPVSGPTPEGIEVTTGDMKVYITGGTAQESAKLAGVIFNFGAPVSGQGASIADWPDFWDAVNCMLIDHLDYDARQIEFKSLARTVDRYIDSRQRSEDSRAKVLEEVAKLCDAEAAKTRQKAAENTSRASDIAFGRTCAAEELSTAIRALASTTPQKAGNE